MKKILIAAFAGLFIVACSNEKKSDDSKAKSGEIKTEEKNEAWVPVDSATMMKNMMDYGTPGPMHQMMASWDGTWTGDMSMWDYDGTAPRKEITSSVNKTIMGGKYQQTNFSGNMMGMPFEGMSIMGYDNASKKFNSSWFDNFSSGIMNMSGNWDEATKTITLEGTMPDINRPEKECSFKETFKIVDADNQVMEMWGPDPKTGKQYKMMEIKMTRKK